MKTDKESSSFGRYLQSIRLKKKISLEKISEETRIAINTLQLIEKEALEALPDEVFVKGFLRSYARAIGADVEQVHPESDGRRDTRQVERGRPVPDVHLGLELRCMADHVATDELPVASHDRY